MHSDRKRRPAVPRLLQHHGGDTPSSLRLSRSSPTSATLRCTENEKAEQGARANDHGCHDPCSEQHGSRQPWSWLILNVRQKHFLMSEDQSLDIVGVGRLAKAIPQAAWRRVVDTACDTFEKAVAPITETTSG